MQSDPIVAEIRQLREGRAARFGFDIGSIVKDAQERDVAGDRVIVRRLPRRPLVTSPSESPAITNASTRVADRARNVWPINRSQPLLRSYTSVCMGSGR